MGLDGVFVFSPQSNRKENKLIVLYEIRGRVGVAQLGGVSKGKERNPNNSGQMTNVPV